MHTARMLRWLGVCLGVLVLTGQAQALKVAIMPLWHRVALAECIVVGKVTAIEDKLVMTQATAESPLIEGHRIAVLKVERGFGAAKGLTHVRIGAKIPKAVPFDEPQIAGIEMTYPVNLEVGKEYCLILQPHHKETFYIAPRKYEALGTGDVALIERCSKLLDDPSAGLKSKNADDRLLTAGMLLTRYKMSAFGPRETGQTAPLDAAESKLILDAIASANWTKRDNAPVSPVEVFGYLQLTAKDGWKQPEKAEDEPAAARQWLKDRATAHRIRRFVTEKPEKQ